MNKKNLTLTIISKVTSNYGEGLGNLSTVQKIRKNGKVYAIRTKESLVYAIKELTKFNDELEVVMDGKVAQIKNNEERNASNVPVLDFGYMTTEKKQSVHKRAISFTDMVSVVPFDNDYQFRNNLGLATNISKKTGAELGKSGLMPYSYEYDCQLKAYSVTIDLGRIGKDENYNAECDNAEKARRVNAILSAIENLVLTVKGYTDNAEPLFVVGGLSDYATHVFENVVSVKDNKIVVSDDLVGKLDKGDFATGIVDGIFDNTDEVKEKMDANSVSKFFDDLRSKVEKNYTE